MVELVLPRWRPNYRAWLKKEKRMLVWDEICENNDLEYFFSSLDQATPLQWTGLVDSNGTYVYEGDILRTSHDRYEYDMPDFEDEYETYADVAEAKSWLITVAYEQKYGRWNVDALTMDLEKRYPIEANFRGEVIGNIYEHPNLLTEK